jgi:hypothetical protein
MSRVLALASLAQRGNHPPLQPQLARFVPAVQMLLTLKRA